MSKMEAPVGIGRASVGGAGPVLADPDRAVTVGGHDSWLSGAGEAGEFDPAFRILPLFSRAVGSASSAQRRLSRQVLAMISISCFRHLVMKTVSI
ncbi:hypothetical protein ACIG5E_17055 [Kitasatospora sp. NPDC053057]|uniref:hypothetical protein n=1 Tax=Kitasatospora sp. NPDC053057 TaxID=3364062 RepID=UPI0037CC531A